jgi:hypothetical protein
MCVYIFDFSFFYIYKQTRETNDFFKDLTIMHTIHTHTLKFDVIIFFL